MNLSFFGFVIGWLTFEAFCQFKDKDIKGGITCILALIALGLSIF
jgi:hypothetical protein